MIRKIYDIISDYLKGERLNINHLNETEPSYSVKPMGESIVRKYLGDTYLRQFTFEIWSLAYFGDDVNVNAESLEKMEKLAYALEHHEDDSFAFFAIEMDEAPRIVSEGISMAKYKMCMSVTYAM